MKTAIALIPTMATALATVDIPLRSESINQKLNTSSLETGSAYGKSDPTKLTAEELQELFEICQPGEGCKCCGSIDWSSALKPPPSPDGAELIRLGIIGAALLVGAGSAPRRRASPSKE